MNLLTLVLGIAFLQVWGANNPLHRDGWFAYWTASLAEHELIAKHGWLAVLAVGIPVLAFVAVQTIALKFSPWLMLPIGVIALLYSFGRGEFAEIVNEYTKACYIEDWSSALERARRLRVNTDDLREGDWSSLHGHVLDEAGYRGFERMYAVLFWFFVLGPVGALLYRLLFLYAHDFQKQDDYAKKVLWIMEWPAVRLLGISFALTGNFVGCYQRWSECLLCAKRSTIRVLSPSILGALSVDDGISQTDEVTRKELELLHRLYSRTLRLWLAAAALIILLL